MALNITTFKHRFHKTTALIFGILLLGLVFGDLFYLSLDCNKIYNIESMIRKFFSVFALESLNKTLIVKSIILGNLWPILFVWACNFSLLFLPIALVWIFKGAFKISFGVACFFKLSNLEKLWGTFLMFSHNIVFLLTLCIYLTIILKNKQLKLNCNIKNYFCYKSVNNKQKFGKFKETTLGIMMFTFLIISSVFYNSIVYELILFKYKN